MRCQRQGARSSKGALLSTERDTSCLASLRQVSFPLPKPPGAELSFVLS
jgi:hypothetical protein